MFRRLIAPILLAAAGYQLYLIVQVRKETSYYDWQSEMVLQSIEPIRPYNDELAHFRAIRDEKLRSSIQYYLPPRRDLVVQRLLLNGNQLIKVSTIGKLNATSTARSGFFELEPQNQAMSDGHIGAVRIIGLDERPIIAPIPQPYELQTLKLSMQSREVLDQRAIQSIQRRSARSVGRILHAVAEDSVFALAVVHSELTDPDRIGSHTFVLSISYASHPVEVQANDKRE